MIKDISNFHETLANQGIHLITCFGRVQYDEGSKMVTVSQKLHQFVKENELLIPMWLSFSAGIELLFKALLLKFEVLDITKGKASVISEQLNIKGKNHPEAEKVAYFLKSFEVTAKNSSYIQKELKDQSINHMYDVNTNALGNLLGNLSKLTDKGVLTENERFTLHNSLSILLKLRRNVDAHTFYGLTVGGSINGDFENLYVPAINLILCKYYNES